MIALLKRVFRKGFSFGFLLRQTVPLPRILEFFSVGGFAFWDNVICLSVYNLVFADCRVRRGWVLWRDV